MLTHNAALSRVFDEAVPVKEKQHLLNHRTVFLFLTSAN